MEGFTEKWFAQQGMPQPKPETVEQMLDTFPVRLWYRDTRTEREWWCSRCYAHGIVSKRIGGQRTVTAAEAELVREKHKGAARCPSCGRIGETISCGMIRNPGMYGESRNFCLILAKSPEEVWIIERCMYVHPWTFQGYDAKAEAAMRAKAAEEAKLAYAQKKQDAAVRAAKKDEADKVKKQLDAVNEKLKKAEESAAEQKKQISMLQDQIREAEAEDASAEREPEESPELLALREEKAQLEKKLLAADPTMARFGVLIGKYQAKFAQLLQMAQDAENRDLRKKMMDVLTRVQASFTAALAEG